MPAVEERVSHLEKVLEEFIKSVGIEFNKLYNIQMRTESELLELKNVQMKTEAELLELKNSHMKIDAALLELKNVQMKTEAALLELKDSHMKTEASLLELKNVQMKTEAELLQLKNEIKALKDENREEHRRMNKKWGEISNKLGTIVEDIIYPALRPLIRQYFHCEPIHMGMNIRRRRDELKDEYDAIVECEDKVFLVEVKATPKKEYIDDFKDNKVKRFIKLFPEYREKTLVLIFASLRLEDDTVNYLTQNKIYAMAYREWEYMDILNFDSLAQA